MRYCLKAVGGSGGIGGNGGDGGLSTYYHMFYRSWGVPLLGLEFYTDINVKGGGGGGGQGYQNGGGGGGGSAFCDTLWSGNTSGGSIGIDRIHIRSDQNHDVRYDALGYRGAFSIHYDIVEMGKPHDEHNKYNNDCDCRGKGGISNQNGIDLSPACSECGTTDGSGGISGGAGGAGGTGRDVLRKAEPGSAGAKGGNKASGGSVKTDIPIIGAKNGVSAVYQAILPL